MQRDEIQSLLILPWDPQYEDLRWFSVWERVAGRAKKLTTIGER